MRHRFRRSLLAISAVLAACSSPTGSAPYAGAPAIEVASPTAMPTSTAVSAPLAPPRPTSTLVPTPATGITATPRPPIFAKDPQGRVLGGAFPILNYSPRMVTGKDCPRVTTWGLRAMQFDNGLSLSVIDNPCAIQNALHDFVFAAGSDPSFMTPEQMKATAPLYKTDPLLARLYPEWWRLRFIEGGAFNAFSHYVCDKPVYRLLNVSDKTPVFNANLKVQQIHFALVSERFEPFTCEMRRYRDGSVDVAADHFTRTAADVTGDQAFPVYVTYALWNEQASSWQFQVAAPTKSFYSLTFAKTLYDAGSVTLW